MICQNVELFSTRLLDRAKYYCQVLSWWARCELLSRLFVPTALILACCKWLVIWDSADDQTRVWTVTLSEYGFMSRTIFVINAWDEACSSYDTLNSRFDSLNANLLFRLFDKHLDVLKYFGLYIFALQIRTDPVNTAIAIQRYREVDWDRTAV